MPTEPRSSESAPPSGNAPGTVVGRKGRRWPYVLLGLVLLVLAGAVGYWITQPGREARALLLSPEADQRARGAQLVGDERMGAFAGVLADRLAVEPDAGAREAAVWALGWMGGAECVPALHERALHDPEPWVRHGAWVALARVAPERYGEMVAAAPAAEQAWDAIGRAAGWLEVGDVRGVETLLRHAEAGAEDCRLGASQALTRSLAPLLEAAGQWPAGEEPVLGRPWSAALVVEVRGRCARLDLQAVASDSRPHAARTAAIRRHVWKLAKASSRLGRFLSWL